LAQLQIAAGSSEIQQTQFTADGLYLVTLDNRNRLRVWGAAP